MNIEFYKRVSEQEMRKGAKVSFVGVYALQWPALEPTDGFVEVEDDELISYLLHKGFIITLRKRKKIDEQPD